MPFWLHEPRIKTHLRSIEMRTKIVFSGAVLMLFFGTAYLTVIYPKQQVKRQQSITLHQLINQEKELTNKQINIQELNANVTSLQNKLSEFQKNAVTKQQIKPILNTIKNYHLTCQSLTRHDNGTTTLEISGSYTTIIELFKSMELQKVPLIIDGYKLTQKEKNIITMHLTLAMD